MSLSNIRIVLVRPLYGGNVGSVCRAMCNTGLSDLAIVTGPEAFSMPEARTMACQARELLEQRQTCTSLAEAVADCGLVAGTTARMGLYRSHAKTPRAWAPTLLEAAKATRVAVVFGPEDKGLSNDEIALCTQIVQIPSAPEYLSINLSHAVMICCYELYVASGCFQAVEEKSPEASSELRERMFAVWREALLAIGFMKEDKADHMMMGLRRILSRGTLTDADGRILLGMARQTLWCASELEKTQSKKSAGSPDV